MRPESLASLSEIIMTNGLTRPWPRGRNRGEGFLGLASMDAPSETVQMVTRSFWRTFVGDGNPLGLRKAGAERAVAEEDALGIDVGFTVAGEFAFDAAEAFERVKGHAVKSVIGAQGVNAVLGMAGVIDEIIGFVPGAAPGGEHDAMH